MECIREAMRINARKNLKISLMLLCPVFFMVGLALGALLHLPAGGVIVGILLALGAAAVRILRFRSPESLEKKMKKAFRFPEDATAFESCAAEQLRDCRTRHWEEWDSGLFFWLTPQWLILICVSGCLICPLERITGITRQKSGSDCKFFMEIRFRDGTVFCSEADFLYGTLQQWQCPLCAEE